MPARRTGALLADSAERAANGLCRLVAPRLGERLEEPGELGGITPLELFEKSWQEEHGARAVGLSRKKRALFFSAVLLDEAAHGTARPRSSQRLQVRGRDPGIRHARERGGANRAHARVRLRRVLQKGHVVRRGDEMLHHEAGGREGHDPCPAARPVVGHLAGKDGAPAVELEAKLLELRRVELGYVSCPASHLRKRLPLLRNRPHSVEL